MTAYRRLSRAILVVLSPCLAVAQPPAVDSPAAESPARAAEPETDSEKTKRRADASLRVAAAFARQYDVHELGDDERSFQLVNEPLLRWTNPVPQNADQELPEVYGGVFLWTRGGRPAVLASIFRWYHPWKHVNLEMLLLSEERAVAELDGQPVWQPKRTIVEYATVPGAGRPAPARGTRLLQMRRIARGFSATKMDNRGNRTKLRLLAQPLYRYEIDAPRTSEVLDGALFSLVHGTDPEIVLLVEARKTDEGPEWQFAAARVNHLDMWMTYGDEEVWRVKHIRPYSTVVDPTQPYAQLKRTRAEVEALEK